MKKLTKLSSFLMIMFSVLLSSCSSDETEVFGNIYGGVKDSKANSIQAVSVSLHPSGKKTTTGSDGRYEFKDLEPGQYTVQFEKVGYKPNTLLTTVVSGQNAPGDIILADGDGYLKLNKTELNFGTSESLLPFEIQNNGTQDISWEIRHDAEWIKEVKESTGITKPGKTSSITVRIDRSKLTDGKEYKTSLSVTSNSGSAVLTVRAGKDGNSGEPGGPGEGGNQGSVSNGLIAHYTFDNENGNDIHINAINGYFPKAISYRTDTPNGSGKSAFLNGQNGEYFNIPKNLFSGITSYSVSMWIKGIDRGVIFSAVANYSNNTINYNYPRLMADEGKLWLATGSNQYDIAEYAFEYTALQDGKWHLITITATPGSAYGTCKSNLYVDGEDRGQISSKASSLSSDAVPTQVQFGGNSGGKWQIYTGGKWNLQHSSSMMYDNIRLYNRALTSADVKAIYNSEK